jgi:uncharacterized protein (DUF3820 family)
VTPEIFEKLLTLEMPYGKYKGRLLADLPGHYLGWFAREGFPKGEIGQLLALMYELDHNNLRALLDPLRPAGQNKTRAYSLQTNLSDQPLKTFTLNRHHILLASPVYSLFQHWS